MPRDKLLIRMQNCYENEGISIAHIAAQAGVKPKYLYDMRAQSTKRKGLNSEDAINLHEYLKSKGY